MGAFQALATEENFLGITHPEWYLFEKAKVAIQLAPYEHTSSYLSGSEAGPAAIIEASHYVEFYDEEIDAQAVASLGICTLPPIDFTHAVNEAAIQLIEEHTTALLNQNKFVVSLGSEHTVTLGFVKAFLRKYPKLSVLQIDAHSDLRQAYTDREGAENPYSHASVMARINDLNVPITQVGIRAQCQEEAELIKNTPTIHTWYAHMVGNGWDWIDDCIASLGDTVYVTIDADGFDPSVAPAVGTAEPGGLSWQQGCMLMKKLAASGKKVVGFDIVEIAPKENEILTQYNMAKLCYKIIGYLHKYQQIS